MHDNEIPNDKYRSIRIAMRYWGDPYIDEYVAWRTSREREVSFRWGFAAGAFTAIWLLVILLTILKLLQ